ncbi:leucine-rich repeat-containing protein 74B-like [Ostrea edulis]|uniref:leucine-rich repeat-containing protein 74B-like n=1 Tax=Ostrea edulis TaxID=37623 RepID=UPI002095F7A6|nr:leucine-rich repeat-containing protein 74B-like [Ostrea edulis]
MDVQRNDSPNMGEKIFRMVTPPAKRDVRRSLKSTSLGMAAKYRLSSNSSVPSSTSSGKQPPNKVTRIRKAEIDLQVQREMEQIRIEEERKQKEELLQKQKQKIKIEDVEDYDFDDDTDLSEPEFDDEDISQKMYMEACKDMNLTPIKAVYKALDTEKLAVVGVILKKKESKACAIGLLRNSTIETLVLESNELGGYGARCIADAISRNEFLTEIRIVENNIGREGARVICEALRKNNYVRRLDLKGNGFYEEDATFFKDMLDENHALRELYLSHNKFQEVGGEIFADGLGNNDFLRVLDLSWNHLRMRGAMAIGSALQVNRHLEKLDISWNGFHIRGALTLSKALEINTTLMDLNLSCNRLSDSCIQILVNGLKKNTTLKVLRIAQNQIYPPGAFNILESIENTPSIALELLDLGDTPVMDTFENLYKKLQEIRKPFTIIYGMVWATDRHSLASGDQEPEEEDLLNEDPLLVLFEYARLQNFRLVDMFKQLDMDNSGSLDREEFSRGLAQVNIPMNRRSLSRLIDIMDKDGDGEIDFGELMAAQQKHKLLLKSYMKGERPIEDTEIGRIDRLLRKVMYKRFLMRKF